MHLKSSAEIWSEVAVLESTAPAAAAWPSNAWAILKTQTLKTHMSMQD